MSADGLPPRATSAALPRFVDLATFARINARLQGGAPREATLAAAGIAPDTWRASLDFWLGRMADEATQQRFGLSQRYNQLYAEALLSPPNLLDLQLGLHFTGGSHGARSTSCSLR